MICKKCNSENSEASRFCAACGAMLEVPAPAPAAETTQMFCAECGSALQANTKFCGVCGTPVGASKAESTVPVTAGAPVSEVPTAAATSASTPVNTVPTPVNAAPAPASTIPTPVNEIPAPAAVPMPVGGASDGGFAAAAQTAAPAAFGTGASEATPAFTQPMADNPVFSAYDMNSAAAVAVKPVKKGGKKALKIVLISLGALLVAAGVVFGLFFREFFHPMFMGNQGYAAKVERRRADVVMESDMLTSAAEQTDVMASAMINSIAASSYGSSGSTSMDSLASMYSVGNIEEMISTYYDAYMEVLGVNAVSVKLDADINLSDDVLEELGLGGEDMAAVIDYINNSELTVDYAVSKDAMGGIIGIKDGSGFTVNAKGVVYSDGTVAFMMPFGSSKCLKVKLDADTGAVVDSEEMDIDIDPAEVERLAQGIVDIYLKYYQSAETTIENGDISIGGTSANPTVKASGRLITVKLDSTTIGEMASEMLTYIADDSYFTGKITEMAAKAGVELSAADYRSAIISAADDVKYSVPFGLTVKTLVNFNGDVLGGAYSVAIPNQGAVGVNYVTNGDDCGFALTAMGMEICSITVDAKNDTDGTIRFELGQFISNTIVDSSSASDIPTGLNIDYTGVKQEKFYNTEISVGSYDIYPAATADSKPGDGPYRIIVENKIENNVYSSSFSADFGEYGALSLKLTNTAYNDDEILSIPSDAFDLGSISDEKTDEESKAASEYVLAMLNDIKAVCDVSSSELAGALSNGIGGLIYELEEYLTPKADYSDVMALASDAYDLMVEVFDKYNEGEEYISEDMANELEVLHDNIEDLYDELWSAYDLSVDAFEEYKSEYNGYKTKWNTLETKVDKAIEDGKKAAAQANASNAAFVGTWKFYNCEMYGYTFTADEVGISSYTIVLKKDGTVFMECDGESAEGTWSVDGSTVTIVESGFYESEFTYDGQYLLLEEAGVLMRFAK